MPKGKKKGKSLGRGRIDVQTSDEDSINDNASNISITSDATCMEEGEEAEDHSQNEIFEEKLAEAIDGMSQKSAQGRANCLESVGKSLAMKFVPDFVMNRKLTITDGIEKCLKRGKDVEQSAAADLASILCVQLGAGDMTDEVYKDVAPILRFIVNDPSKGIAARSKCCHALGFLSFLANIDEIGETMQTLENVFSGSFYKGDGTVPNVTADMASLHYAAISAWTLLLTVTNPRSPNIPSVDQLAQLLDSAHLDVRLAAGESIAVLYEQGRQTSDDWEESDELIEKLRQLATDSSKHRAKKDRKTQRSSFRDILRYIENDEFSNMQMKFGQEALLLDSWCKKKQYDAFCQVLASGLNHHLAENEHLRDILDLGEKISPINAVLNKQTKHARHLMNAANFKARSISRAKNRDKRSAVIAM